MTKKNPSTTKRQPIDLDSELIADLDLTTEPDAIRGGASKTRKGEIAKVGAPFEAC